MLSIFFLLLRLHQALLLEMDLNSATRVNLFRTTTITTMRRMNPGLCLCQQMLSSLCQGKVAALRFTFSETVRSNSLPRATDDNFAYHAKERCWKIMSNE